MAFDPLIASGSFQTIVVLNRPNPELWRSHGDKQVYLTAPTIVHRPLGRRLRSRRLIPDLHHYNGSFGGRVFPLWRDAAATDAKPVAEFLESLEDVQVGRDAPRLPGLSRLPWRPTRRTRRAFSPTWPNPACGFPSLPTETVRPSRRTRPEGDLAPHLWRALADPKAERPQGPPRLPKERAPQIPKDGAIPDDPDSMPDEIGYDDAQQRLLVGTGFVENVPPPCGGTRSPASGC